jgi:hypothetical protein
MDSGHEESAVNSVFGRRSIAAAVCGGFLLSALFFVPTRAAATIMAQLEEPANDSTANAGISLIRGWAFSTTPGATIDPVVQVSIDGAPSIEVTCCSSRGDVQANVPNAPLRTGFGGVFNWQLLPTGAHVISVVVKSSQGESQTLTATFATSRLGTVNFAQSLRFSDNGGSHCTSMNSLSVPSQAMLACTNVILSLADGSEQICASPNVAPYVWDRASQGFRLAGGCTTVAWPLVQATTTPCPVSNPTPVPPNGPGNCPVGYTPLSLSFQFGNNTFGLDSESAASCQTNHYCANLPVDVKELKIFTADRNGPAACGNITLTVTPPASSGIARKTSHATNNTIKIHGNAPSFVVPAGTYLLDVLGGPPGPGCTTSTYLIYWQY